MSDGISLLASTSVAHATGWHVTRNWIGPNHANLTLIANNKTGFARRVLYFTGN